MTNQHEETQPPMSPLPPTAVKFDEEIMIEDAGFSFRPINGFELEIDGSVYMYSDDGNVEISMVGGELEDEMSIAELNDDLADEFMESFDEVDMTEAGTESVGEITGFLDEIRFTNAEEEGAGQALICAPYVNQFFFILVIASQEYWDAQGLALFNAVKSQVRFHPQFKPDLDDDIPEEHPDLTIESYENIANDEDFVLTIQKGDDSLLLAAQSFSPQETITLTSITGPHGARLYQYDPESQLFESPWFEQPISGSNGEVCLFLPRSTKTPLKAGPYSFSFSTASQKSLQTIQVIIRSANQIHTLQKIDLNFWLALQHPDFDETQFQAHFITEIRKALNQHLLPVKLAVGEIDLLHPAPDELESFIIVNMDSDMADCSYMISESVSNQRALHIGLVEQLTFGEANKLAYVSATSSGRPGMILVPSSPHACVLVAWPVFKNDYHALADAIIQQLIVFSGIEPAPIEAAQPTPPRLTREIAWALRRHPLFYEGD